MEDRLNEPRLDDWDTRVSPQLLSRAPLIEEHARLGSRHRHCRGWESRSTSRLWRRARHSSFGMHPFSDGRTVQSPTGSHQRKAWVLFPRPACELDDTVLCEGVKVIVLRRRRFACSSYKVSCWPTVGASSSLPSAYIKGGGS